MRYTLVHYQAGPADLIGSIHRAGCARETADIAQHEAWTEEIEASSPWEALGAFLTPELREQGWDNQHVKMHRCAHEVE